MKYELKALEQLFEYSKSTARLSNSQAYENRKVIGDAIELLYLLIKYVRPRKNIKTRKNCRLVCDEMESEDYEKVLNYFGVKIQAKTRKAFVLKEKESDLFIAKLIKVNSHIMYQLSKNYKLLFRKEDIENIKNIGDFEIIEVETRSLRTIKRKLGGANQKQLKKWSYVYDRQRL